MKRLLTLLLLTTLLFTSCELIQDKPPQPKVWGVYIGLDYENSTYDGKNGNEYLAPLLGTLNDARELKEAFSTIATKGTIEFESFVMFQEGDTAYTNSTMHTINGVPVNSYASFTNIETLLEELSNVVKKEDLLIVTYHGHGNPDTMYLAPKADSDTDIEMGITTDLLPLLASIKGRTLVILDSCYSGMSVPPSEVSVSLVYEPPIKDWFETY